MYNVGLYSSLLHSFNTFEQIYMYIYVKLHVKF